MGTIIIFAGLLSLLYWAYYWICVVLTRREIGYRKFVEPVYGAGYQLDIVSRKGKKGLLIDKKVLIAPCEFDYIGHIAGDFLLLSNSGGVNIYDIKNKNFILPWGVFAYARYIRDDGFLLQCNGRSKCKLVGFEGEPLIEGLYDEVNVYDEEEPGIYELRLGEEAIITDKEQSFIEVCEEVLREEDDGIILRVRGGYALFSRKEKKIIFSSEKKITYREPFFYCDKNIVGDTEEEISKKMAEEERKHRARNNDYMIARQVEADNGACGCNW